MSGDINWRAEAFAEYDPNLNEIKKLDTLMHAFWILLQKTNGFTNEMLDEALAEAIEIESTGPAYLKGMVCPSCGRKAQLSGSFKIKCIYCGMESIINPYEARDIANQVDEVLAQQEEEAAQKEKWDKAVENDPYQPYDVSKDLNFDDFDDNNTM
jgi:hypothetical protein